MSAKAREPEMTFEKALERLEEIVAEMEGGELSLDRMMADFEEGNRLVKFCGKRLNEVERKIEVLLKENEGLKTEPFEDAEGNPPAEGSPPSPAAPADSLF